MAAGEPVPDVADSEISYRAALALSRRISRLRNAPAEEPADEPADSARRRLEIVVGGNCNVDFLKPGIEAALWADGVNPVVRSTDYDDWIGAAIEGRESADAWVIWLSSAAWSRHGQIRPEPPIEAVGEAVRAIIRTGALVVVVLPEPDPGERDPFSPFVPWRQRLVSRLRAELAEHSVLLDPTTLLMQVADDSWSDLRYWIAAKCPWSPDAATRLGALCGHTLARLGSPKVRAIVVDLDDTLWGGLVGELGADGVMLDPLGEGAPFLALQRLLKDLSDHGVMLAAASKNNLEDALSVFERRTEMIVKRDDLLGFEVHWASKAESVRRIAHTLNVGLDAICFLDDSPHERAEMRQMLPEVIVPELPEAPEDWSRVLHASRLFLKPVVRQDDIMRVGSLRADAGRRRHEEAALDRDAYLAGLQMRLAARPIGRSGLSRAAELILKTNQFNLTNRRHSDKQILSIAQTQGAYAYAFDLADVFGESGTVGVVLALPAEGPDASLLEVDSFVMSCRVINRTVELAMFVHLAEWARLHGFGRLRGRYVPSARNRLVADFYSTAGLSEATEAQDGQQGEILFEGSTLVAPSHRVTLSDALGELTR